MMELAVNARFRNRPVTGVERFATEVCEALKSRDDVSLLEIDPGRPLSGLKGHAWEQFLLPGKTGGKILFSPCNTGPVRISRQFPVIHDAAVWDCPEGFSKAFGSLYRNLLPAVAKKAALVGTVSAFSKRQLAPRLGIPEEKIVVLGNAVDARFRPPADRNSAQPPTLLCVGSLDPRKNLPRLLSAWRSLKQADRLPEEARLEIVGSANPQNFAHFDLEEAPGVDWLGRLTDDELIAKYQQATAFIFPSFYEGFGLPPLEAMACGCPVLLSHAASLPEVGGEEFREKDPHGKGASLYFDPLSTVEIETTIERALTLSQDQQERIRRLVLERARSFSWAAVAKKMTAALERGFQI